MHPCFNYGRRLTTVLTVFTIGVLATPVLAATGNSDEMAAAQTSALGAN